MFHACYGRAYSFRFKDWSDFSTAADGRSAPANTDCEVGVGDGSNRSFQLQKKYVSGSTTEYRVLSKPVSGTVVVALDGAGAGGDLGLAALDLVADRRALEAAAFEREPGDDQQAVEANRVIDQAGNERVAGD